MSDLIERWYPSSEGFAVLREAMKRGQNHEEWARISPAEAKAFRDDFAKGRDLIEAQQAEITELRDALDALIDDEPCHKDHHGYCQSHGLNDPCEVAVARELLGK